MFDRWPLEMLRLSSAGEKEVATRDIVVLKFYDEEMLNFRAGFVKCGFYDWEIGNLSPHKRQCEAIVRLPPHAFEADFLYNSIGAVTSIRICDQGGPPRCEF
ncbi:hypothetical protein LWI28_003021 [Acer negundo]|uniref:Uncharacterized protein n=1 Tax=Acer negundo TaxID=4023 RepID=A0AAD5JI23_ACENE|nr:hypothetical protein LWI28_003021 [Acer negundo]